MSRTTRTRRSSSLYKEVDHAATPSEIDRSHSIADIKFSVNALHVCLYGLFADPQRRRNFLVSHAIRCTLQHLDLALRQGRMAGPFSKT